MDYLQFKRWIDVKEMNYSESFTMVGRICEWLHDAYDI